MKNSFDSKEHIYKIDGKRVPSNTEILAMAGLVDTRFYTEEGKQRGKAVHYLCQLIDERDVDWATVNPAIEPYGRGWEKFILDTGFKPELIEVPMYNYAHSYGTTIDRKGSFPRTPPIVSSLRFDCIVEIKSGAVEDWAGLQLAGQNECLLMRLPRFVVQLKSDGSYRLEEFVDPNDRNVFLSACTVVHWKKNHGGK